MYTTWHGMRAMIAPIPLVGYVFAIAVALTIAGPAFAQTYPAKPIRLIVPYPAGGPTDLMGRMVAEGLRNQFGQPVLVENRAGASGNLGTDFIAKSAPDGYTIGISGAAALAVNVSLFPNLPYDPRRDFTPITKVVDIPTVLVVPTTSPATSVATLIELARKRPGQLNFGSPASGTTNHLLGELLRTRERVDITHIPYKGNPQATEALLRGEIDMMFDNLQSALPHWRAGKLRALAVTGRSRVPAMRDVPLMSEQGYPGFEATAWFAIVAPKELPAAIQAQLHAALLKILREPDFERRVEAFGMRVATSSPEDLAGLIAREGLFWADLVKSSGARVD
jgi:tripartite-type tricarboxylate transporter receptor subunit TctC